MEKYKNTEEKENHIYRKCKEIYIFLLIIFAIVLVIIFSVLFDQSYTSTVKNSGFQFFLFIELIIIVVLAEEFVCSLAVWEDSVVLESWILFKQRTEIPYKQINNVKTFSIFWIWGIEIYTGNDIVTRYKYLEKYKEAEKEINEHINKKQ